MDAPSERLGKDLLLHKGLEIDKALAAAAGAIDLAIRDGKPGKPMACATTMIASFVQHRFAWAGWTRRLLALSCLNGCFLIQTDQPGACSQERSRLTIGLEHRASPLQEDVGIMNMLPGVIAPGANTVSFEPATHGACRNARQAGVLSNVAGHLGSTPARERYLALTRQATGDGDDLCTHLRGKNASVPHCEARRQGNGW